MQYDIELNPNNSRFTYLAPTTEVAKEELRNPCSLFASYKSDLLQIIYPKYLFQRL